MVNQGTTSFDKDLKKALDLSKKSIDKDATEWEEMERVLATSRLESDYLTQREDEQLALAIQASLGEVAGLLSEEGADTKPEEIWTWTTDDKDSVESIFRMVAPATTPEVTATMEALKKPLRLWPNLYNILGPIRKLLDPNIPFEWGEEQSKAWSKARTLITKELTITTDSESETEKNENNDDDNDPSQFETWRRSPSPMEAERSEKTFLTTGPLGPIIRHCEPAPRHAFCGQAQGHRAYNNPPYYGLSEEIRKSLRLEPPITPRILIKNLAYGVDETKLYEVFSMSGRIVQAMLHRHEDGHPKGQAIIVYAHPLEAIQAMWMFREARFLTKRLIIEQDKIGPQPIVIGKNPDGLVDVRGGIGPGGSLLKISYINGDAVIHSPECSTQGEHPITNERGKYIIHQGNLGGVVRLEAADWTRNWADTTLAQEFANTMYDKLRDLVDAGYNCSRQGVPQAPHIQGLIRLGQGIQDEYSDSLRLKYQ